MKTQSILIALVIGCGGASSKPVVQEPKPEPVAMQKPPAPACAAVADKLASIMAQEDPDAKADSIKARADAVTKRCEADQWSEEARECFGTAENEVDGKGCSKFLTEAQMTAVGKDVEAADPQPAPAMAPAPEAKKTDEAAPRRSRGGTPKKQVPKSSSDPCMGGE
jgi:hypothetical protein